MVSGVACLAAVMMDGKGGLHVLFVSFTKGPGIQEGDGPILLVVLHCKPYGRINTIDMLKEALFVDLLVDDKGVIHIPAPEPGWGRGSTESFLFQVLHVELATMGLTGEPMAAPSTCS